MINITIDGKPCQCEKGEYLLDVAKRSGISIPTLCHHPALGASGRCRVCVVEVVEKGRGTIVVSCMYPVEREIEVYTNSERVQARRGLTLALLKLRAPNSDVIAAMCEKYGAPETPRLAPVPGGDKCILCALCVTACNQMGNGAISTVGRGVGKAVETPFTEPSEACIGCAACAGVCPTGAIEYEDTGDTRSIWHRSFALKRCESCGAVMGTVESVRYASEKYGADSRLCPQCKKAAAADSLNEYLTL